jgi:hypothetical protein
LPCHALVTEMALLSCAVLSREAPKRLLRQIKQMRQVVSDLRDVDVDVVRNGDDDGGRVIALDEAVGSPGRAVNLLMLGALILPKATGHYGRRLYSESGWWSRSGRNLYSKHELWRGGHGRSRGLCS